MAKAAGGEGGRGRKLPSSATIRTHRDARRPVLVLHEVAGPTQVSDDDAHRATEEFIAGVEAVGNRRNGYVAEVLSGAAEADTRHTPGVESTTRGIGSRRH